MKSNDQKNEGQGEQKLADIFDNVGIGIYRTTPDGRILMANPAMVRMLEFSSFEELSRRNLEDEGFGPCYRRSVFKQRIEEENRVSGLESEWITRNGARLVVIENARVVRDENGRVMYYEGTVTDITQRKRFEEELYEREQLYRSATEDSPILICHFLKNCEITFVNATYCKYFGKTAEELVGSNFLLLIPEEDRQEVLNRILALTIDSPSLVHEHRVIDLNGHIRWQRWTNHAFFDRCGNLLYFESFGEDITEHRKILEDLAKNEAMLRSIIDHSAEVFFIHNTEHVLTYVSPRSKDIFGYEPEEMMGEWTRLITDNPMNQAGFELTERAIQTGIRQAPYILEVRRKDGELRIIEVDESPIKDEDGNVIAVTGAISDITQRWNAEKSLKDSEEKFRLAMETTNDALWDVNLLTKEVYRNPRHAIMLGYEPDEIMPFQYEWEERIHPDDRQVVLDAFNKHLARKSSSFELEYRLRKKSGEYIWILGRGKAVAFDEDGSPIRVIGTNIDITERKKAEEALRESEQRLRAVFDNLVDGVLLVDLESRKFYMGNRTISEMLGYDQEELRNLGPADIHPEQNLAHAMEQFGKVIRRELKIAEDLPIKRKDGSIFYADINTFPLRIGTKEYFAGVFRDVTDRKLTEESLRRSEEKYRTLVESAGESIASINKDGVFLFMNEVGAERLGGRPEDFVGKTMWDVFPKEVADRQMGSVIKVIEAGESMNVVVPTILQDQMRWYNTTIGPLRDHSGRIVAVMVVARDIHELKKAEEELSKYRQQMSRAEQLASLGTLSATFAHQITQPLTVIRLCLENALDELEGTSCSRAVTTRLSESIGQVSNITSIVNNFRNFARRSSDTWIGLVSVWAVAQRVTSLMHETARQARVKFILENLDGLGPVMLRERELEQLFFALIENSIQAADGKEPRQIVITGSMKGTQLELRFCDNCGGITEENIGKVFEPFFTTKPPGRSTGLGLCIAQDVVGRAGGRMDVESEFGVGTTFIVTLPASEAASKPRDD